MENVGKDVSYPFGYGLSYTTFEYGKPSVNLVNGVYKVNVEVRNSGNMAGREVVEIYAASPDSKAADRPEKELKAFAKTPLLAAGETCTVTLTFSAADLASFDTASSSWVVAGGNWNFLVGASSRDIRSSVEVNVKASSSQVGDFFKSDRPLNLLTR